MGELTHRSFAVQASMIAAGLLLLAPTAPAAMVTVDGNVVFYDDYEHDVNQSEPQHPEVGAWTATNAFSHVLDATSQATDPFGHTSAPLTGPAAAYGGNQFFRLFAPASGSATSAANFGAVTAASGSHTIVASFAMYIPSSADAYTASFALSSITTYPGSPAYIYAGPNHDVQLTNGVTNDTIRTGGNTGDLTYLTDTWQIWTLDYTMNTGAGNDSFTVSVGGVTSDPLQPTNAATGSHTDPTGLQYLLFDTGGHNGAFFVDAPAPLPEPASLGLLALGGLAIARRRR